MPMQMQQCRISGVVPCCHVSTHSSVVIPNWKSASSAMQFVVHPMLFAALVAMYGSQHLRINNVVLILWQLGNAHNKLSGNGFHYLVQLFAREISQR